MSGEEHKKKIKFYQTDSSSSNLQGANDNLDQELPTQGQETTDPDEIVGKGWFRLKIFLLVVVGVLSKGLESTLVAIELSISQLSALSAFSTRHMTS